MKILAIDTSAVACSVALINGNTVKLRHEVLPLQHAKCILPFIEEVLDSELASLDAVAWGCGPGSFTGLRIAASIVQAIGFVHKLPIISVSSLAAIAQTAYLEYDWQEMLVAIDARMSEVYWGIYRVNSEGYADLVGMEGRSAPAKITFEKLLGPHYYGVGDAWSRYPTELQSALPVAPQMLDANCLPKALAVAHLARVKYEKGEWLQPFDALPSYLRDNVVVLPG